MVYVPMLGGAAIGILKIAPLGQYSFPEKVCMIKVVSEFRSIGC